jgi:hypothetical protein
MELTLGHFGDERLQKGGLSCSGACTQWDSPVCEFGRSAATARVRYGLGGSCATRG